VELVATTRDNLSPSFVLEFLKRISTIIKVGSVGSAGDGGRHGVAWQRWGVVLGAAAAGAALRLCVGGGGGGRGAVVTQLQQQPCTRIDGNRSDQGGEGRCWGWRCPLPPAGRGWCSPSRGQRSLPTPTLHRAPHTGRITAEA